MGSTKTTVDKRVADILNYICEREGFDPNTLQKKDDSPSIFTRGKEDMEGLKETITYLKDFAKMQAIAEGIGSSETLEKNIELAKADFQKVIEEKEAQIKSMPRVTRKKINTNNYGFQNEMQEQAQKQYEAALEERRNKIASLRQDIKLYKNKVKKLDTIKKSAGKPGKLMQLLFPEEYINLQGNYAKLVNLCVASMTDGYKKKDLIGDDKVFKYDGEKYTVNYNNARKFISAIKSRKELLALHEYIEAKNKYQSIAFNCKDTIDAKDKYDEIREVVDTKEFKYVTDMMNQLIGEYNKLNAKEDKAKRGNFFTRLGIGIKVMFGFRGYRKIPEKILDARADVANQISQFSEQVKKDPILTKAFEAYNLICWHGEDAISEGTKELEWAGPVIEQYGPDRATFPTKIVSVDTLKAQLARKQQRINEDMKKMKVQREEAKQKALSLYRGLTKKSKKLLTTHGEKNIEEYVKTYYTNSNDKKIGREYMSPSSAAVILENLLSRKGIPWERVVDSYAEILGKQKLEDDRRNIEDAINSKLTNLKESIMPEKEKQQKER